MACPSDDICQRCASTCTADEKAWRVYMDALVERLCLYFNGEEIQPEPEQMKLGV